MPAYAVCHLREITVNRELIVYLRTIDDTLEPFNGRFLVHGKPKAEVVEGKFPGNVIIIEFPDYKHARGWYHSEAYQQIVSLRIHNSDSSVILVDGVPDQYCAVNMLDK